MRHTIRRLIAPVLATALAAFFVPATQAVASPEKAIQLPTGHAPSWRPLNKGLPVTSPDVSSVAIGKTSAGTIVYAATRFGLFTSTHAGKSWTHGAPTALPIFFAQLAPSTVFPVDSLAVDGANAYLASPQIGTFATTDGGTSWTSSPLGPFSVPRSLVVQPDTSGQTAYGAVWYKSAEFVGLYKTTDGGTSWQALPDGPAGALVASGATIYGLDRSGGPGFTSGVNASSDGGVTWSPVGSDWPSSMSYEPGLAVDRTPSGATVYAAAYNYIEGRSEVLRSIDGGPWVEADTGISGVVQTLAVDRSTRRVTLYAGTDTGAFKSTNQGASWTSVSNGMSGASVHSIAVDRNSSKVTIYAGTDRGVFVTTNRGSRWSQAPLAVGYVNAMAVDPGPSGANVYASSGGLFRSTNGGRAWTDTGVPSVRTVAVDRSASGATIYAAGDGVFRSTDEGLGWTQFPGPGPVWSLAVDRTSNSSVDLYAGSSSADGLFKSTDQGGAWSQIGPNDGSLVGSFATLGVDRTSSGSTIFAGASPSATWQAQGGVYRSMDGGATWTTGSGITDTNVNALLVDRTSSGLSLYAGTERAGVFRSTDGGASWVPASTGLPQAPVRAMVIGRTHAGTSLYAGTYGKGVFLSTDGGTTWTPVNAGLADAFVNALAVDSTSSRLTVYAGTYMGVFALRQ